MKKKHANSISARGALHIRVPYHPANLLRLLALLLVAASAKVLAQSSTNAPPVPGAPPITASGLPAAPQVTASDEPKAASAASDDAAEKERFDIYLSSPEMPKMKADAYLYKVSMILALLKNNNPSGARNLLPQLAQTPELDEGLSTALAGKVDAVMDVEKLSNKIKKTDADLQNSIDKPKRSQDEIDDSVRKLSEEEGKANKKSSEVPPDDASRPGSDNVIPPPQGVPGTPALTEDFLNNLQTKAKIDANEQGKEELLQQAQAEFRLYVSRLYSDHHYYHVILAAEFYRQLFGADAYPPDMNTEVNESQDINGKVGDAVKSAQAHVEMSKTDQAAAELETAFRLDSLSPEVLEVPQIEKAPIETFRHQLDRMESLLQARDFSGAETALQTLAKAAPDYDASYFRQLIETAKLKSETLLSNGKLLIREGNAEGAVQKFQDAEQVWPSNPELLGGALPLLKSEEARNQAVADFDQLMAQKDYFAISAKSSEFTSTVLEDSLRQQQLRLALRIAADAKGTISKASAKQGTGDIDGAWEIVQRALAEWPESVELNKIRGDLADKAGTFALAIGKAQEAENRQELGLSLSWYAVAQHLYPGSTLAKEGISRLSTAILNKN